MMLLIEYCLERMCIRVKRDSVKVCEKIDDVNTMLLMNEQKIENRLKSIF